MGQDMPGGTGGEVARGGEGEGGLKEVELVRGAVEGWRGMSWMVGVAGPRQWRRRVEAAVLREAVAQVQEGRPQERQDGGESWASRMVRLLWTSGAPGGGGPRPPCRHA